MEINWFPKNIANLALVSVLPAILFLSATLKTYAQPKMHELENYFVIYELSGNSSGTKQHASRDYGRKVCWIEKSEMSIMGDTVKKNEKVISMMEDGEQWIITINFDEGTGTKMKNPLYSELAKRNRGQKSKGVQ